ncbi:B-cell receptor CD22-like, partial [Hippocampus comes]|uniref:B-cell receptor CD22-like n=1 Tax=Hippocampus comes TaxID=109280 RepID=UPI00094EC385
KCVSALETNGWGGSYDVTTICGLRGSSVELVCTFWYPQTKNASVKTVWFTKWNNDKPEDLRSDPQYAGRLHFDCQDNQCRLSISQLRGSDAGVYKFRFVTTVNSYTVTPGVTLTVTDLNVQVGSALSCVSKCNLDTGASYIWYKDGQEILNANSYWYYDYRSSPSRGYDDRHSYSCAIRGYQQLVSPPLCPGRPSSTWCNRVLYEERSICALKGSTVDISCTYSTYYSSQVTSKFWFTKNDPRDLKLDDRYKARVELFEKSQGQSTLRINNLMESDSADYRFTFTTKGKFTWKSTLPGTILTVAVVQVQVVLVTVKESYIIAQLLCHLSCSPPSPLSFCWSRNGQPVGSCAPSQMDKPFEVILYPGDYVSCAVEGYPLNVSAQLYAPMTPFVSPSDPGEIVEGDRLILTCRTNPAISYRHRWFKKIRNTGILEISDGEQLVFKATKSSDSAEYFCTAENELGAKMSEPVQVDVKYAPRNCSLLVRPSKFPEEGQSVTLTCSSYAKPETNYTLYKDDQPVRLESGGIYRFISIRPQDAGRFYCKARNEYGEANSSEEVIEVMYSPRPPEVSAKASDDIRPGSWVSLTCSSDAKPNASYAWYKATEETPLTTAAVYNISDYQAKHAGEYRCVAHNAMGSRNATLWLQPMASSLTASIVHYVAAGGAVLVLLLVAVVLLRKKMTSKAQINANENCKNDPKCRQPNASSDGSRGPADDLVYSTVTFSKQPHIYANVVEAQRRKGEDQDEDVEYSLVNCDGHALKLKTQEDAGVSELDSAVQKRRI